MSRAAEFVLVFFGGPALFAYARHRIPAIPALWALTAWCLFMLSRDPGFDGARLWSTAGFGEYAPAITGLFLVVAAIGVVLVRRFTPGLFLNFPRTNPRLWAAVMVLYPVLSVYPQGIVYRTFLFERYAAVFRTPWAMVPASAAAFAWVHIVFRNKLAVGLTFLAGILFALRYVETGSLFVSSFEHALYGCAIFTVGLGRSFFYRSARR